MMPQPGPLQRRGRCWMCLRGLFYFVFYSVEQFEKVREIEQEVIEVEDIAVLLQHKQREEHGAKVAAEAGNGSMFFE